MIRFVVVSAVLGVAALGIAARGQDKSAAQNPPVVLPATVTFTEQGDGMTMVHVLMQWADPPGGALGEAASRMLQNPYEMLEEDLQRFKDIAEGRVGSGLRR